MVASSAQEAVENARARVRSRSSNGSGYCLKDTRGHLELNSFYMSADDAWDGNDEKHAFNGWDEIPLGAPCWSQGSNPFGHIFLKGGRSKSGVHYTFTNDKYGDGRIDRVPGSFYSDSWGHRILGWATELNEQNIPWLDAQRAKPMTEEEKQRKKTRTRAEDMPFSQLESWEEKLERMVKKAKQNHRDNLAEAYGLRLRVVRRVIERRS